MKKTLTFLFGLTLIASPAMAQFVSPLGSTAGNLTGDVTSVGLATTLANIPAISGVNLTNLNGTNISSGTVADGRLSANVPLLNAANTFTAAQIMNSATVTSSTLPAANGMYLPAANTLGWSINGASGMTLVNGGGGVGYLLKLGGNGGIWFQSNSANQGSISVGASIMLMQYGGPVSIKNLASGGASNTLSLSTDNSTAANTAGGNLTITAGNASGTGGTSNGGSIILTPGTSTNGIPGVIQFAGDATSTGSAPVPTGTGTPTIVTGSTDTSGEVTSGTSATSIVITFAKVKSNAPFCTVTPQTQLLAFAYTISTTAITITQTATTGEKIDYICLQH